MLQKKYGGEAHIRALVRESSDVSILSGLPVEIMQGDITDPVSLQEPFDSVDVVFHCAGLVAYTKNCRQRLYQTNVRGTAHVVNTCLRSGVGRLVLTSSVAAIGLTDNGAYAHEETVFSDWQHRIAYMETKRLAEMEGRRGIAEGLDVVSVNPGVVIGKGEGPGQHTNSATEAVIAIHRGKIPLFPSGGLSLVDIRDVAQAHLEVWQKGVTGERYIVVSENWSYRKLFEMIRELPGKRPGVTVSAGKILYGIAGLGGELYALFTGRKPYISVESMQLAKRNLFYSNRKSVEKLDMAYRPVRETVHAIVG